MKQIIQSYRTGTIQLSDVPLPSLNSTQILVQTASSAVSLGTEEKKVKTARKNIVGKARSRPDLVQQVIQTAQREGITSTYHKVMNRLDQPIPLGYSMSGVVIAVGAGINEFQIGDRVACGGVSAAHAEIVAVPSNLCVKVPENVKLEHAAFTTIGAIALQGLRQAEAALGEWVAVIGLGLVGQLVVQLLKANGCRVIGIDLADAKVAMAQQMRADVALSRNDANLEAAVHRATLGNGVDSVLVTASTTSNDPAELAVQLCRDRGRIVIVGGVRLDLPRDACYEKELDVRLSRSYGPGRYDPTYEEKGIDYPIGYVRWTEKRNMAAFIDLLAVGRLNLDGLITHRFSFSDAENAYELLAAPPADEPSPLGILFEYDMAQEHLAAGSQKIYHSHFALTSFHQESNGREIGVGFIGAGSFARKFLLPALVKNDHVDLIGLSTSTGISGQNSAEKFEFDYCTGDYQQLLADDKIDAIFIATHHNTHAKFALDALVAGKAVFVEKPLALNLDELHQIIKIYQTDTFTLPLLTVGFNRRFAPHIQSVVEYFQGRVEPMNIHCRVNAGFLEDTHWLHDLEIGGGRIIGEVCHFIDLVLFLVGVPAESLYAVCMQNVQRYHNDNVSITIKFRDGSLGTILYVANGSPSLAKERLEIFCQGKTAIIDDFCRLEFHSDSGRRRIIKSKQDKGHKIEVDAFIHALHNGKEWPIPLEQLFQSTQVTFKVIESLQVGLPVMVNEIE